MTVPEPRFARIVRGSGRPVVLAHGAGGSTATNFGPIIDALAEHHTVIGVDLPGSGDTPGTDEPLDANVLADQLVAAAHAEGFDSFAIAGWSLGAALAIRAAARHPERVTALILTSAFAHADARLRLAAGVWHDLYEFGDPGMVLRFLMVVSRGTQSLETMTEEQMDAALKMAPKLIPKGTAAQTELVQRIDVREDLPAIKIPTCVIVTTDDPLVSPSLQRALAAAIPRATVTELDTGHLAFTESANAWQEQISRFLQAQPS